MSINNQNKPGYKHTPLGWIPEEWDVISLGEVALIYDGTHMTPTYTATGVPFYSVEQVTSNNFFETKFISRTVYEKEVKRVKIERGDILMTRIGDIGTTRLIDWDVEASFYVSLALLKPRRKYSFSFLNFFIQSNQFRRELYKRIIHVAFPIKINLGEIGNCLVIEPHFAEKERIAAILSTWDEAITKTQQLIAQLQQRNKGLMQQLLAGKKRLKGFEGEWMEVHLGDVFTERNETGYINLDLLSIGSLGVYPQSQSEKRDISNTDKSKYKRICPGDIGYNTMRMWQGRSALSGMEGIVSPAYTIVTPKVQQHSEFYAYLFKLPSVVNKFFRNSQGLVEDTLNCKFKDLAIVKVEVPEYNEQVAIAQVIQQATDEVKLYEQKLAALQQQKKGLMQKLLTGEVRVKL